MENNVNQPLVEVKPTMTIESGLVIPGKNENNKDEVALAVQKPLSLTVPDTIILEINDILYTTPEEKREALLGYLRSNVLKAFNCLEIGKVAVQTGKMYFNGNMTKLKMPGVKMHADGRFAEDLRQYAIRARNSMNVWLNQSQQNAYTTAEDVISVFDEVSEMTGEQLQEEVKHAVTA